MNIMDLELNNHEYARTYKGTTETIEEAYDAVKKITDQLYWSIDDNLDIYIGVRDKILAKRDGCKFFYYVKIIF